MELGCIIYTSAGNIELRRSKAVVSLIGAALQLYKFTVHFAEIKRAMIAEKTEKKMHLPLPGSLPALLIVRENSK